MDKIRFLHIVKDDKFFSPVRDVFDGDEDIVSKYVYYSWNKKLRYLDGNQNVEIFKNRKDFVKRLQADDYDVVYLHSLHFSIFRFIKHIPSNKIIIWWAWGSDIYDGQFFGLKSFIHVDVKKLMTRRIVTKTRGCKDFIVRLLFSKVYSYYRKKIIGRFDYFQPVIDIDYDLMKKYTGFSAKEFYLKSWSNFYTGDEHCGNKPADGSIMLGNSASAANNHVDAWDAIRKKVPDGRSVIVPLSYGSKKYAKEVKKQIVKDSANVIFLDKFLPREEYFNIVGNCSYAVYGSIRQHAMGNVYNSLRNGLKVFLFKDSFIYKYLTGRGYIIFALEDVDENSFLTPLTISEQRNNLSAMKNEMNGYRAKGKNAIESIKRQLQ